MKTCHLTNRTTLPPDEMPDDMLGAYFGELPDAGQSNLVVDSSGAAESTGFAPVPRAANSEVRPPRGNAATNGRGGRDVGLVREQRETPAKAIPANLEAERPCSARC